MSNAAWTYRLTLLIVAGALLAGCAGKKDTKAESQPMPAAPTAAEHVPILDAQHGQVSDLKTPVMKHITTAAQFEALGLGDAEPADFNESDMVVVGLGQCATGGYWVQITGLQKVGDTLYVQADVNRPGPDAALTQALSQPYSIVTVPQMDPMILRSDFTSLVGQTPAAE